MRTDYRNTKGGIAFSCISGLRLQPVQAKTYGTYNLKIYNLIFKKR